MTASPPLHRHRTAFSRVVGLLVAAVVLCASGVLTLGDGADGAAPVARTTTPYVNTIAAAVLAMLNHERARNHLPALASNRALVRSAHAHNLAMAAAGDMSHQVPGEAALGSRLTKAGYHWSWAGENIGWNSNATKSGMLHLQSMMYGEKPPNDGHRLNILEKHFRNVGVDVYRDAAHHRMWLTTDFGAH